MPKKEMEKKQTYIFPRKLVATFIGFIGVMLMLSRLSMTGAIIGVDGTNTTIGVIGIFLLLFALLLYAKPSKKKL